MSAEARLAELGITLPEPARAAGLYSPCVQSGALLFVSGQIPSVDGQLRARGHLGAGIDRDQGAVLARTCALNGLAVVRAHLGSLDRVARVVKVNGYVASAANFTDQPLVVNGASQLLIDVFGEAGRHARAAVGVAELPLGAPVEVEFVFEVATGGAASPAAVEAEQASIVQPEEDVAAVEVASKRPKKAKKKKGKKG
jgi:enamine deaminase RidA (YjgF/YER057c/UK114 family)